MHSLTLAPKLAVLQRLYNQRHSRFRSPGLETTGTNKLTGRQLTSYHQSLICLLAESVDHPRLRTLAHLSSDKGVEDIQNLLRMQQSIKQVTNKNKN